MFSTIIIGSGSFISENIIDKEYFLQAEFYDNHHQKIDKSNEEIIEKFVDITEIAQRRYVEVHTLNSDIATKAAEKAIEDAQIDRETLDYIICASNFGDIDQYGVSNFMPSLSSVVKHKLGIKNPHCINYDMIFGCPGWVESMILADTLIKSGRAKKILVVGSETLSKALDPHDRDRMIFSDGAGAVVVQASLEKQVGMISDCTMCFNQEELNYLCFSSSLNPNIDQNKKFVRMMGRKIYEFALKNVPSAIKNVIDKAGKSIEDIDKILIHQANAKMDHAMVSRLYRLYNQKEYDENIAPMTVQFLGNTSVATIPTMYDLIMKNQMQGHQLKSGQYVIFASVGAGMNINAVLYKMP